MARKQIKIEDLAVIIKRGFDSTATKEDLRVLATKTELQELRKEMATKEDLKWLATKAELQELRKEMLEGFRLINDDLHDIKNAMGPLVRVVAALNTEVADLRTRVERLEKRIGVK